MHELFPLQNIHFLFYYQSLLKLFHRLPGRDVKNPNIVAVRFIGPVNKAGFINETPTKNYFIPTLLVEFILLAKITS